MNERMIDTTVPQPDVATMADFDWLMSLALDDLLDDEDRDRFDALLLEYPALAVLRGAMASWEAGDVLPRWYVVGPRPLSGLRGDQPVDLSSSWVLPEDTLAWKRSWARPDGQLALHRARDARDAKRSQERADALDKLREEFRVKWEAEDREADEATQLQALAAALAWERQHARERKAEADRIEAEAFGGGQPGQALTEHHGPEQKQTAGK